MLFDLYPGMIKQLLTNPILIFGCGNTLMGDDGFGPAVIDRLTRVYALPEGVWAEDVGTSIGDLLFDMVLSPSKPRRMLIVDAVMQPNRRPGEVFEMGLQQIPANKAGDFCMHQFPSVNLLLELQDAGVDIRLLAGQMKRMPDKVRPGLSRELAAAVPTACRWVLHQIDGKPGICGVQPIFANHKTSANHRRCI